MPWREDRAVRFTDNVRIALSALWQQKVRTCLTVAGIAIGTFALAVSLSLGNGFHAEVDRQLNRGDQMRQVWVFSNTRVREEDVPPEKLELPGDLSPQKRERLRKALIRRWPRSKKIQPPVWLNEERVQALGRIPHVESVVPMVYERCDVHLGGKQKQVNTSMARLSDEDLRDRVVAGEFFGSEGGREVLIGEYLLYELGIVSDEQVAAVVGKKLRIAYPVKGPTKLPYQPLLDLAEEVLAPEESKALEKGLRQLRAAGKEFSLTPQELDLVKKVAERGLNVPKGPPGLAPEEAAAVEKALKEMRAAYRLLSLDAKEKAALNKVLTRYLGEPVAASGPAFEEEFTIAGVVREYIEDDENLGMQLAARNRNQDLFLPPKTAERLFRHGPQVDATGFDGAFVIVDKEENTRAVVAQVKAMGLRDYSLVDFVEKLRASMKLSTFLTSFLAFVAVLSAALGITNTMFMSVLERTREIGVMKAVGARDRHILLIFLVEGALLGVLGGSLGVLGCWLISFPGDSYARDLLQKYSLMTHLRGTLFIFPWWLVLGVPFFAGVVTTLAALYPARRAARINPIAALRHE